MKKVLILHGSSYVSRATTLSHLRALGRMPDTEVHYHHLSAPVTPDLRSYPFDGVIINYCFIMQRQAGYQDRLISQYEWLRHHPAVKIALPMDDCYRSAFIEEWCERLGVTVLYTPLFENMTKIYPNIFSTIDIRPALTGYVDEEQLPFLLAAAKSWPDRQIDVGTRVARSPYAHGRYAILKADYAEDFAKAAPERGLHCDISTRSEDALVGADWYAFLGNCRATIGMKGGYGLIDPQGDLRVASTKYLTDNPGATYDEVASICFTGHNHLAEYSCISPRIFECAATKTLQIMPPSNYLECLSPWTHYIPLSLDLSEIEDVVDALADEALCAEIAEQCFRTLIQNKWFTHDSFVKDIYDQIPNHGTSGSTKTLSEYERTVRDVQVFRDALPPILQVALAHLFLYIRLHGAERHVSAFVEWALSENEFVLPGDTGSPSLAHYAKDWFSASYVGQINLLVGLGLLNQLSSALMNCMDDSFGPLSYWNWAFCGSVPEVRSTADAYPSDLHVNAARGQYEALVNAAGFLVDCPYRRAGFLALFAWSKGDFETAKRIGFEALEGNGASGNAQEDLAANGIAAALFGMLTRLNDKDGLLRLIRAKAALTDSRLIDAIEISVEPAS